MTVFSDVKYHISFSLSPERQSQLIHVLDDNGATNVQLGDATHVVTNSNQFEGWQTVSNGVVVVTDKWVTRSVQAGKMQPPQYYSADPSQIFSGVVACATDLPSSDLEVLSAGITALGGQWRVSLTRDVTHLFSISTGSKKYETALHFQDMTKVKVLLPHWFDDAVRLGIGALPTTEYEWPNPRILRVAQDLQDEDVKKSKMAAAKKTLFKTAVWTSGEDVPVGVAKQRDIWRGQKILLSTNLELTKGRREAVEAGIKRANGVVVAYTTSGGDGDEAEEARKIEDADVLITRYRAGAAYVKAVKANKTIGTLPWLFHVESTGVLSRPMDQLLHYPVPKQPIEGFSGHEITVTNYTGESREYIKKLISAMGAQFTPSMSGRNTVLVAAYISGNKSTKARNWSIPIVNHTWLEDCFIQWRNLTVGLEKYIVFPPGIDFAQMLGERGVGRAVLEDVDLEQVAHADEVAVTDNIRSVADTGRALQATNTSARDEKEVEDVVGLLEEDPFAVPGDDGRTDKTYVNNAKETRGKGKSKSKSPSKPISSGLPREGERMVRYGNKSSPSKIRAPSPENDEDDEGAKGVKPVSKLAWRSVTPPELPALPSPRSRRNGKKAVVSEDVNEPGPSVKKRRNAVINDDDDEEDDSPRDARHKSNDIRKAKARAIAPPLTDTDDEDLPPAAVLTRPPKVVSTMKGKAKAIVEATPSVASPVRSGATPKRVPSVVIRSPTKKLASPMRTESMRIAAAEIPLIAASKRGKPAAETPQERAIDGSRRTPSTLVRTPSKRSAATKANQKLHDELMPDLLVFQQEMRNNARSKGKDRAPDRNGNVDTQVRGGRRKRSTSSPDSVATSDEDVEERVLKKRKVSAGRHKEALATDESDDDHRHLKAKRKRAVSPNEMSSDNDDEIDGPKKQIRNSISTSKRTGEASSRRNGETNVVTKPVKLMTTQVTLNDEAIKALTKLGVKITTKPSECTHLLAPHLVRTEKFLCALAVGPFILSEKWALDSASAKTLLPEEKYLLRDPVNEKKYGFKLTAAIDRAKRTGGKIFMGKTFYVTPKVPVEVKLLKNVATAGGGQVLTQAPTLRVLNANKNRHVISCPADASIWKPLSDHYPIYSQELLLTGALRQDVDWEDEEFRVPGSF